MAKIKPWLLLPSALAHKAAPFFLSAYGARNPFQTLTWRPFTWRGLQFTNPLGVAGGVDKNGAHIQDWWTLGPGFIEVGTITPLPQGPNPGKILDRNVRAKALWNKMGFPNDGVERVLPNLVQLDSPHFTPVFVNIGKNRATPNEKAYQDYLAVMKKTKDAADVFVVNISSPNTEGLRELVNPEYLRNFLAPLIEFSHENTSVSSDSGSPTPILVKLSPDMSESDFKSAIHETMTLGVDGWIISNTTRSRPAGISFPAEGGLSGQPLSVLSLQALRWAVDVAGTSAQSGKLIVSVGGVMSPQDVFERLSVGADLVQVYTALIYEGPFFFRAVAEYADRVNPV